MRVGSWVWGGALALLVVVAVVAALIGRPEPLPGTSPEGVVQRYLQAVFDRDVDTAVATLTPELASCRVPLAAELEYPREGETARLLSSTVTGDTARVTVEISRSGGAPLEPAGRNLRVEFALRRDGERWRISAGPWPVPFCGTERP